MRAMLISLLMDPFMLLLASVIAGMLFGGIRLGKFSFGTSGALFSGILIGWGAFRGAEHVCSHGAAAAGYDSAVKLLEAGVIPFYFFDLFLILFMTALGLLAAENMGTVMKRYGVKFVVLSIAVTITGAVMVWGITALTHNTEYEAAGVYAGALTSSPGLAAALETGKGHAERQAQVQGMTAEMEKQYISRAQAQVGTGYAVGYPLGVVVVIVGLNLLPRLFRLDVEKEKRRYAEELARLQETHKVRTPGKFSILAFATVGFAGYIAGHIQIWMGPLGYFSLGTTGGILVTALLLGAKGRVGPLNFHMDPTVLIPIRQLGTVFFLAVVGLRYGYKGIEALGESGLYLAATTLAAAGAAMLVGFLIGHYVFKINWVILSGAVAGGMTSTPGLSAAVEALEDDGPASGYGAAYPLAVLCMVVFTILLYQLPF